MAHMSSILFGDTMVPNIEQDYILLLGYSISYKEYNLTRFNHKRNTTHMLLLYILPSVPLQTKGFFHRGP